MSGQSHSEIAKSPNRQIATSEPRQIAKSPHPPFPYRVRTTRLLLRCWEPSDAPALIASIESNLDHLRQWMPWAATEPEAVEAKARRLQKFRARFDRRRDFI